MMLPELTRIDAMTLWLVQPLEKLLHAFTEDVKTAAAAAAAATYHPSCIFYRPCYISGANTKTVAAQQIRGVKDAL